MVRCRRCLKVERIYEVKFTEDFCPECVVVVLGQWKPRKKHAFGRPKLHGATCGGTYTPEYLSWRAMKGRCLYPKAKGFARYGARGIIVCPRWIKSFDRFLRDVGPRPSPLHTLDRIDGSGPYCRTNCRWATPGEQRVNRTSRSRVWRCRCLNHKRLQAGRKPGRPPKDKAK